MIDVIIPTLNCADDLRVCLRSLKKQTIPINIIVVDGNSIDKTVKVAKRYGATVLFEPKNLPKPVNNRLGLAKNIGLDHSTTEFVGFLDSDVIVPETWAEDMIEKLSFYFKAGAITSGCVQEYSNEEELAMLKVMQIGSNSHARTFKKATLIDSVQAYNSVYRRKAIDEVGGFDERLQGCEDWELNNRIRKAGWYFVGIPKSPVHHKPRSSQKKFLKEIFGYAWSRGHLLRKKHIFTPIHAVPSVTLVLWLLSLFLFGDLVFILLFGFYWFAVGMLSLKLIIDEQIILMIAGKNPSIKQRMKNWSYITGEFIMFHLTWAIGYVKGLVK